MAFSLRARVVFPVDRPPIQHGVVTIEGERIMALGTTSPGGELIDLGDAALLPGLVNAHTHLEFSHLREPIGKPGMPLPDWIRLVIAERGRGDASALSSAVHGANESLACGVTTLCDISTVDTPIQINDLELVTLLEVIGFSRARAHSSLSSLIERLDRLQRSNEDATSSTRRDVSFGISPHAPYTVSPDLLRHLVALAKIRALTVAMHIAESREELEFLATGSGPFQELLDERSMWDADAVPRGSRSLDYLCMLADAPRALVIHGNYLDDDDWSFLARHRDRMSLVYCPRTHAHFGHPKYPLAKTLASGVRVALGTDSRASNPDLDLLSDMRCVANAFPELNPHDVLRMGTLSGAEALGGDSAVGSIMPGKWANLIAVPLPTFAGATSDQLLDAILAGNSSASTVWLHGKRIAAP